MPIWASVSYVGHKNPWEVKKVKSNSYKALPRHTPLAESEEPFAFTRSHSCWGKKQPEKYSLSNTTQNGLPPYWWSPASHTGIYSKGAAAGFPLAWEVQSQILMSFREAAIHSGGFNQEVLNLRGAESFGLHLLHAWEIQLNSNSLSKHSPFQYMCSLIPPPFAYILLDWIIC